MPSRPFPLLVPLAALSACGSEAEDTGPAPCAALDPPTLCVEPALVDFGAVSVLDEGERTEQVTITNCGGADLHIAGADIEDHLARFSYSVAAVLVAPGQSTIWEVTYQPATAAVDTARLSIDSDDPDAPAELLLLGEGVAPVLTAAPAPQDFGEVTVGCAREQALVLLNQGTAPLVVREVYFHDQSSVAGELGFGGLADGNGDQEGLVTLDPAEHALVWVSYLPLDEVADEATLLLTSNDPLGEQREVALEGSGAVAGWG